MTARPARLTVLGATGSIGTSTLDVVERHPERFRVVALTGHRNATLLAAQCRRHRPEFAVVADAETASVLADALDGSGITPTILCGPEGLLAAARAEADITVAAIVGAAGLPPTLAAVDQGHRVLLANKESLVMGGALFMERVRASGATLLPLDSEHNAIFQCLAAERSPVAVDPGVRRVLLTASGGPFRDTGPAELRSVTAEQACRHPNWSMGRKISVDSATLMNKGLEVIEACWLFGLSPDALEVVVHPQSVIHSLVEFRDGSMLAQMGTPDMRIPIAYALAWPERVDSGAEPLDLFAVRHLDFQPPDLERFRCLQLAYHALASGGDASIVLNAANEVAVDAFLEGRVGFMDIAVVIEETLEGVAVGPVAMSLEAVMSTDRAAREAALRAVEQRREAR